MRNSLRIGHYGPHVTVIDEKLVSVLSPRFPVVLENWLKPCECGGRFKTTAPYRCIRCRSVLTPDQLRAQVPPRLRNEKDGIYGLIVTAGSAHIESPWQTEWPFDDMKPNE